MQDFNYVFAYFTGESEDGEQIYFSTSEDGFHWEDFNDGKPALISSVGERGVRDPFLFQSVLDQQYYLLGTDLRIAGGCSWEEARDAGSRKIVIWTSEDLIHWSAPWVYAVDIGNAGCAWAPEAIYDKHRGAYLVFWASCTGGKQIIYASYTKDFKHFTECFPYMEYPYDVIDATIVEADGKYYRFFKDEREKYIRIDCGTNLHGRFEEMKSETLRGLTGVEGPIVYPLKETGGWCLMIDQFAKGGGYRPLRCRSLEACDFSVIPKTEYDMGRSKKRHGSVLLVEHEVWRRLRFM